MNMWANHGLSRYVQARSNVVQAQGKQYGRQLEGFAVLLITKTVGWELLLDVSEAHLIEKARPLRRPQQATVQERASHAQHLRVRPWNSQPIS